MHVCKLESHGLLIAKFFFFFFFSEMWFSCHWRELVHPLHLPLLPKLLHSPSPPSSPPCLILPHFIALLNADNWWQMDCAAHCASVALGVSGRLGAGKEGRAEREWGVLAAARRLAQVAENQYRSGLWLGLTAQEQWSVGIHWVPHTQLNWMMEQRKCRGEREGQRHVIPHYHNDRVTRILSKHMHE